MSSIHAGYGRWKCCECHLAGVPGKCLIHHPRTFKGNKTGDLTAQLQLCPSSGQKPTLDRIAIVCQSLQQEFWNLSTVYFICMPGAGQTVDVSVVAFPVNRVT